MGGSGNVEGGPSSSEEPSEGGGVMVTAGAGAVREGVEALGRVPGDRLGHVWMDGWIESGRLLFLPRRSAKS